MSLQSLSSNSQPGASKWPASLVWRDTDSYRWLTRLVLVGIGASVALAIFGLPPIDLHSPLHFKGIMDPLCGMTRAVRALALGDVATAIEYNPASLGLGITGAIVVVRSLVGWRTGRWFGVLVGWRRTILIVALILLGLLWWRQQANAELLMQFGMG